MKTLVVWQVMNVTLESGPLNAGKPAGQETTKVLKASQLLINRLTCGNIGAYTVCNYGCDDASCLTA